MDVRLSAKPIYVDTGCNTKEKLYYRNIDDFVINQQNDKSLRTVQTTFYTN